MPVNPNDPRVSRTRQLIMSAFTELVEEQKNVYSISVQEITTRASINRATFYAHFEDKYAFLECWIGRNMVHPDNSRFEPLFEIAMQKELYKLLLEWLNVEKTRSPDMAETTALVVSWGIFGAAVQWSRDRQSSTAEAVVHRVLEVAAAAVAPVLGEQ